MRAEETVFGKWIRMRGEKTERGCTEDNLRPAVLSQTLTYDTPLLCWFTRYGYRNRKQNVCRPDNKRRNWFNVSRLIVFVCKIAFCFHTKLNESGILLARQSHYPPRLGFRCTCERPPPPPLGHPP